MNILFINFSCQIIDLHIDLHTDLNISVEGAEESGSSQESSREASREASRTPSREATPTHSEASTHGTCDTNIYVIHDVNTKFDL